MYIYIYITLHIYICIYIYIYIHVYMHRSKQVGEKKKIQSQQPSAAGLRGQRSQAFSTLADEDLVLAL